MARSIHDVAVISAQRTGRTDVAAVRAQLIERARTRRIAPLASADTVLNDEQIRALLAPAAPARRPVVAVSARTTVSSAIRAAAARPPRRSWP